MSPAGSTQALNLGALQAEQAARVLCRRRLIPFTQRINPRYDAGWVHHDIARRLERFSDEVAKGLSPRLMILMPPRAGKSELASRMFPAWHLGRHPDHEIIACSYNVSLAMAFSRKVKSAIDDPAYQSVFATRLNPNNQSVEEWGLANDRGGYVAAGVGGGINGKGAHILLVDDALKNAEEADSPEVREKLWDWYGSTAYTRLAPGGGVLNIQCMTGDTPVLLPDGTEKRLDAIRAGDVVATYENGNLTSAPVTAWRSNGRDFVLKITTSSGKIVRSNGRHPFLVYGDKGLEWRRARSLTTAHKIVAAKGSGVSGRESLALGKAATNLSFAGGTAPPTTQKRNGLTATDRHRSTRYPTAQLTSSIGTVSLPKSTPASWMRKAEDALYAASMRQNARPLTGGALYASTIATQPTRCADYCATTATLESDTLELSELHSRWLNTSEFTTDQIVSIESDGVEEVFDVQIERTENFIANGLVSHNTWWHDDDLAGRLQAAMASDPEADQFEVVKYPAIAIDDEYLDLSTDLIVYGAEVGPDPDLAIYRPLRHQGEALHPTRYDLAKLNRIKKTIPSRFWSALYQQNPVPEDGAYFTKDQFKTGPTPDKERCNVQIAWDFAITEKKQNDYTVGTVTLQDEDDLIHVAEMVRFKSADSFFMVEAILNLVERWASRTLVVGFEDGQIYKTMAAILTKRMRERRLYFSIELLTPITDKMARARPLQARMQQGMVVFAENAPWLDTIRSEMLRFPAGVHDDCVDSLAWNASLAINREPPRKARAKPMKSWKDRLAAAGRGSVSHMSA